MKLQQTMGAAMESGLAPSAPCVVLALMLFGAISSKGAVYTWEGTIDRDWDDADNWNPSNRFPGDGTNNDDTVVFTGNAANGGPAQQITINIDKMTFSSGAQRNYSAQSAARAQSAGLPPFSPPPPSHRVISTVSAPSPSRATYYQTAPPAAVHGPSNSEVPIPRTRW